MEIKLMRGKESNLENGIYLNGDQAGMMNLCIRDWNWIMEFMNKFANLKLFPGNREQLTKARCPATLADVPECKILIKNNIKLVVKPDMLTKKERETKQ